MRKLQLSIIALLFAACSSDLAHEAPFDPEAPLEKQAKASLDGTIRLEGETDHSQVTLELQNDARTYNVDTAADGVVRLTGIVPGEYTLKIRTRYFQAVTEALTVDMGDTVDLGTRVLSPLRSRVLGLATAERVRGAELVTSGGVTMTLKKTSSVRTAVASAPAFRAAAASVTGVTMRTVSGNDGGYEFGDVPAGGYQLYASSDESDERAVGDVTVTGEGDVNVDPVVLRPLTGFFEILGSANGTPSKLYTSVANVNLQLQQSNALQVKVSVSTDGTSAGCDLAAAAPEALPSNSLRPLTFTSEGKKLVCVSYVDADGKETEPLYGTITYDATPPGPVSVTPVVAGAYIKNFSQLVNIAAVDTLSGVAMMATSATSSFTGAVPTAFQPTTSIPYASAGSHTTYFRIYDNAGNYQTVPLSVSVVVDPVPPSVASYALQTQSGVAVAGGNTVHESKLVLVSSVSETNPMDMQLTIDGRAGAWEPFSSNKLFELNLPTAPAGEARTISAVVRDAAGNVSTLLPTTVITLDTVAPTGTVDIVATAVTSPSITVNAFSADALEVELAFDPGFVTSLGRTAPGAIAVTLPLGDGPKTVYGRFFDAAGNASGLVGDTVTLDTTVPQLPSFSIAQGTQTNQQTISLVLSAVGADWMRVAESATCGGAWEAFATSKGWTFASSTNETKTLTVQFKDNAGNATACLTRTIEFDNQAPTFTAAKGIVINGDDAFATSRTASLALNVTGAVEVMVSESATFAGAAWQAAVTEMTWTLSAGEGVKSVYMKARDGARNETSAQTDAITVDTIAPAFNSASGPSVSSVEGITLSLSASGATQMRLSEDPDFVSAPYVAFGPSAPFTLGATEGTHTIYVQLSDAAGNESIVRSVNVMLDKSAPSAPVVSILGGAYTTTAAITLQVLADGASEMLVSQYAPMTDATWQPFSQLKAFTLAGGQGAKTVCVRVRDGAGNASAPSSASITLDSAGPSVTTFQAEDAAGNVITESNTTRFYLRLAVTDATPVTVQFNTSDSWAGIPSEAVQTLRAWDAAPPTLAAGENRNVYVRAVDAAGNATVVGPVTVLVDTLGPTAPSLAMAPALVSSPTVTLTLGAVNADSIELSEDISFLAPTVIGYTTSEPYTFLDTTDGVKTLYARYVDALGNYSGIVVASVTLDQTAPKFASFSIAQASPTKSSTINLSLAATGADFMAISENACSTNWEAYAAAKAYAFATMVNGTKTLAVRFKDAAGNATGCLTQTIDFDDQAPQLLVNPFRINYGDAATSNATVTLVSNVVGATDVRVSEDSSLADAAWVPYSATRTLVLSAGNGTKTVYAQFRDTAGNVTAIINDTIVLDTTQVGAPYISIQTDVTSSTTVTVNLGASNIDEMMLSHVSDFSVGTGWVGYTGVTTYTFGGADGTKTLFAKFRKTSGAETAVVSDSYILDRAAPSFSQIVINGGAQYTTSNQLTLSLTGVDDTSGVQVMETYEDGDVPTQDQFKPALVFPVTATQGLKTVWVRFADRAMNWAAPVSATIVLDSLPPSVASFQVEDAGGTPLTISNTARVVVHIAATDANSLQMLVSNRSDFAGSAWQPYQEYLQWDLPLPTLAAGEARTVYAKVRDAAGTTVSAGSYGLTLDTIAPSNAGIDIAGTAVTVPTVTVNFTYSNADFIEISQDPGFQTKLTFAAVASTTYTFAVGDGAKTLYARFRDNADNYSATVVDQITLDSTPPQLAAFSIAEASPTNHTTLTLALSAIDAAQMQVREGATCGGTWESFAAAKALPISAVDGTKSIAVRYRDAAGNTTGCLTKSITLDTAAPTYTAGKGIVINGDDTFTTSRTVSLALNVTDATQVLISENATFVGAAWQPAVTATTWNLSAGEGSKTLYLKTRDDAGNESAAQSDVITVDTLAPSFSSVTGPSVTSVEAISLAIAASGATKMRLSESADLGAAAYTAFNAAPGFTLTSAEGAHTIYVQLADDAGNESLIRSVNVTLDKSAPDAPVVSVVEGAYTKTAAVTLQVLASGATEMLVSQYAPMTDATWQPFSQVRSFTLAGAQGAKTIYVRVRDGAGNTSAPSSATVTLDASGPDITTFQAEDAGGNVITQTNSTRFYLRLALTDASPVTVQFNTSDAWSGIPSEAVQTLRAWDAAPPTLAAGENRTVYVRALDAAGNATVVGPVTVLVDTLGPAAPSLAMAPALVSSPTVTLTLGAVNASDIELSEDISFLAPTVIAYSTSEPYTFADTTDGVKTLYARYVDALGNYSGIVVASVTLDQTEPKFPSFTIAQASPTKNSTINLSLSATGADFMAISENACTTNWEAYQTAKAYSFASAVNGTKTIAVRFKDTAGNTTSCITQTIDFDDQAPQFLVTPFRINYGDAATSNATVTLVSNVAGATEVKVSEDSSLADAAWVPYSATRTFVLSAGNGTKTVYAQYRDAAGNTTATISDAIVLDTTTVGAPYISIQTEVTSSTTVTVNLGASNIDEMMLSHVSDFSAGTGWVTYTGVTTYTFGGADGTKTLFAKFRKTSGAETAVVSDSYILDRAAPSFSQLLINNGAQYTTSNQLTLALTGVDDTSGVQVMEVYEDGNTPTPQAYVPALVFPVSAPQGLKIVWVRFADRAMNYAAPVSAMVVYDAAAPVVSSFTVEDNAGNALSVASSARVVVHLVASDANPLQMLVSNRSDFAGSAWQPYQEYLQWDLPLPSLAGGEARTVYAKVRDAAGATVSAGSYGLLLDTLAPSNAGIDIIGTATTSATVSVNLTYSNADFVELSADAGFQTKIVFAAVATTTYTFTGGDGVKTLYARYRDNAFNYSATVVDQITLDTTPPQLAGFTIDEGTLTNQTTINLALTAIEAAQMQTREGTTCGGTWETFAMAKALTLTAANGAKTIAVRYRDAAGNTTACLTKTITLDTLPPTLTAAKGIVINGDDAFTKNGVVNVALNVTGAASMMLSNSPAFGGAQYVPVTTATQWTLEPGDGTRTVYAKFKDAAGNVLDGGNDTVVVDTTPPANPSVAVNAGASYTAVTGVTLTLGATDAQPLQMQLSNDGVFDTEPLVTYAASSAWDLTLGDGAKTVYARFVDAAGNTSAVASATLQLDTSAPQGTSVVVDGGAASSSDLLGNVVLTLAAFDGSAVARMKLANVTTGTCADALGLAADESFQTVKSWVLYDIGAGKEGSRWVCAQFRDGAGNWSTPVSDAVYYDTNLPAIGGTGVLINGGDLYSTSPQVQLVLAASGASEMMLGLDAGFSGGAWEPFAPTKTWTFAAGGDGVDKTVYVKFRDASGNVAGPYSDSITLDTVVPATLTMALDGGAEYAAAEASYTRDVTIDVTVGASSWATAQISDDVGFQNVLTTATPTTVFPVAVSLSTNNRIDGAKVLYARFFDAAGNVSAIISRSIVLDSVAPAPVAILVNAGAASTSAGDGVVQLTMSAADSGSGVARMRLSNVAASVTGASDEPYNGSKLWAVDNFGPGIEGLRYVWLQVSDRAGNWSAPSSDAIFYDTLEPTVNAIAFLTAQPSASRTADVQFDVAGATEMILGHDIGFTNRSWEPYSANRSWTFNLGGDGVARTLFVKFRDAAGNTTTEQTADFTIDDVAPQSPVIAVNGGTESMMASEYSRDLEFSVMNLSATGSWDHAEISADPAFSSIIRTVVFGSPLPFSDSLLSGIDGAQTIYARFFDAVGNVSAVGSDTFLLDTIEPAISRVFVEGIDLSADSWTWAPVTDPSGQVDVNVIAADSGSGLNEIEIFVQHDMFGSPAGELSRTSFAPQPKTVQMADLTTEDMRRLVVRVYDSAGNWAEFNRSQAIQFVTSGDNSAALVLSDPETHDTTATRSKTVSAQVTINRPMASYQISESPTFSGASWVTALDPYKNTQTLSYTFATGGDGVNKTLYFRYKDTMGLASDATSDDIVVDNVAPALPAVTVTPYYVPLVDVGFGIFRNVVSLSYAFGAGVEQLQYNTANDFTFSYGTLYTTDFQPKNYEFGPLSDGPQKLYFRAIDQYYNASDVYVHDVFIDTAPPQVNALVVNGGAAAVNTMTLALALDAEDPPAGLVAGSGLAKIWITPGLDGNGNCDTSAFVSVSVNYAAEVAFSHWDVGDGTKQFYVCVADRAGNLSTPQLKSIDVDMTEPQVNSFTSNDADGVTSSLSVSYAATSSDGGVEVQLANEATFVGAVWQPVGANIGWALPSGDGTKTVYARFRDAVGNVSATLSADVVLDTVAPVAGTLTINGGQTVTNSTSIAWAITASDNLSSSAEMEMQVAGDPGFGGATWVPYVTSGSTTIAAGDGLRGLYVRFRDKVGNLSLTSSGTFTLDQTGPIVSSITFNGGATVSTGAVPIVYQIGNWAAGDKVQVAAVSNFAGLTEYAANAGVNQFTHTLSAPDGAKAIYVRAVDALGNFGATFAATVTRDATAPTGSITLPASRTRDTYVAVDLTYTADVTAMKLTQNATCAGGSFTPALTETFAILPALEGTHDLSVQFRDEAGNLSGCYATTVELDTTGPLPAGFTVAGNAGAAAGYTNTDLLTLSAWSAAGDCASAEVAEDVGFVTVTETYAACAIASQAYTLMSVTQGTHDLYLRFTDTLGNVGAITHAAIIYDTSTPSVPVSGAFTVAEGDYVNTSDITLLMNASGADMMSVYEGASCLGLWGAYAPVKPFSLSAFDDTKTLAVQFKDASNNVSSCYTRTVTRDTSIGTGWTLTATGSEGSTVKTANTTIGLAMAGADADVVEMKISNIATFTDAAWLAFASPTFWNLPSGDGPKTVYVMLRDRAGNQSSKSVTITLDTLPPDPPALQVIDINSDGFALSNSAVELRWSIPTGAQAFVLQRLIYGVDQEFQTILTANVPTATYTDAITTAGARHQYRIRARDDIDNWSSWSIVAEALPYEPVTGAAWVRSAEQFQYSVAPNAGTFTLSPTYRHDDMFGITLITTLAQNVTSWLRPIPGAGYFNEAINYRTANQDSSLVYDSLVPLKFSERETITGTYGDTELALDKNGAAHICHRPNGTGLAYATNKTGAWVASKPNPTATLFYGCAIALDAAENVYIAYWSGWAPGDLMLTYNSGEVLHDDFEYTPGGTNWATLTAGVERNALGMNEPSGTGALNLDGGGDIIESVSLVGYSNLTYSYYFERQGGGEVPDPGDYLYFEYYNGSAWVTLQTHDSTSGSATQFTLVSGALPAGAQKVRFRSVGSGEGFDDFFVDDFRVKTTAGTWLTRTIDPGPNDVGLYPSLKVDAGGKLHIAYYDNSALDLKYANNVTDAWNVSIVDSTGQVGAFPAVALDGSGNPSIVYQDTTNTDLKIATKAGVSWSYAVVDSSASSWASFELDSIGDAHVAYYQSSALRYKKRTAGVWGVQELVDNSSASMGWYPDLTVDAEKKAHITYLDNTNQDLRYATNKSGTWISAAIDQLGDVGGGSAIMVDRSGKVHTSYQDATLTQLKYATYVPGNWTPWRNELIDAPSQVGGDLDATLDANGVAHVAYWDSANRSLKYATNPGGVWSTTQVDDPVANVGRYPEIALSPAGKVHIAYQDFSTDDVKFATNESGSWVISVLETTNSLGSDMDMVTDLAGNIYLVYVDATAGRNRFIWRNTAGVWSAPVNLEASYGDNSLAIDSTGRLHLAFRYSGGLRYMSGVPGTWTASVVVNASDPFYGTSIKIDPQDKVHIAAFAGWPGRLDYITNKSGSWVMQTVEGDGDAGTNPSLVLDARGGVHIFHQRADNLRYATNQAGYWQTATIDPNGGTGFRSAAAIDQFGRLHVFYQDALNYDVKYSYGYFSGFLPASSIVRTNPF